MTTATVAVYGASGHTGRFVARELKRRGCAAILVSRGAVETLSEVSGHPRHECRQATCDDWRGLDSALEGAAAIINCAGPFAETAPAIAEAALRLGIHYLDITAEQRSVLQTFETYRVLAMNRGIAIVPAMAFYGGLPDLLATAISAGARSIEAISIAVALDSWHPTLGTRRTGEQNTARRMVVSDGHLVPLADPAPTGTWRFREPFGEQPMLSVPLSEMITISRHLPVAEVNSFINTAPLEDLSNPATPPPRAADSSGRSAQRFAMDVVATVDGKRRRITATGQDIYAVTAPLVVEACLRLIASPPAGGTYAAGQLFNADSFLDALSPAITIETPSDLSPLRLTEQ